MHLVHQHQAIMFVTFPKKIAAHACGPVLVRSLTNWCIALDAFMIGECCVATNGMAAAASVTQS